MRRRAPGLSPPTDTHPRTHTHRPHTATWLPATNPHAPPSAQSCGNVYVCNCGIRLCSLGALKRHCKQFGHEAESNEPMPDNGGDVRGLTMLDGM